MRLATCRANGRCQVGRLAEGDRKVPETVVAPGFCPMGLIAARREAAA